MAAPPSDRERIATLEECIREHGREIQSLRESRHRHAQQIQANSNDLAVFKARLIGMATGLGAGSGLLAALLVKLLDRP